MLKVTQSENIPILSFVACDNEVGTVVRKVDNVIYWLNLDPISIQWAKQLFPLIIIHWIALTVG